MNFFFRPGNKHVQDDVGSEHGSTPSPPQKPHNNKNATRAADVGNRGQRGDSEGDGRTDNEITDLTHIDYMNERRILAALEHPNNINRPVVVERLARVLYNLMINSDAVRTQVLINGGIKILMLNISSSLHRDPGLEGMLLCVGALSARNPTAREELGSVSNLEILVSKLKPDTKDNIFRKSAAILANIAIIPSAAEILISKTNAVGALVEGFVNRPTHCRTACSLAMRNLSAARGGPEALAECNILVYVAEVVTNPMTFPENTRGHVSSILANMTTVHELHFSIVENCLEPLIKFCEQSRIPDETRNCTRALANLATNADARPAMILLKVPQVMLLHLVNQDPLTFKEMRADCVRCIGNLCLSEEGRDITSLNDGIGILVDVLVKALVVHDTRTSADTLWAICCLCSGRETEQADLMANGGLVKIIECSRHPDRQVQYMAARVLEVLSEFPASQQHLIEQNGLDPLSSLSHCSDQIIRQRAKRALYTLAHTSRETGSPASVGGKSPARAAATPPPPPPGVRGGRKESPFHTEAPLDDHPVGVAYHHHHTGAAGTPERPGMFAGKGKGQGTAQPAGFARPLGAGTPESKHVRSVY